MRPRISQPARCSFPECKESDAWEEINYPRLDRGLYQLDTIVSRKKQLLPLITQLIQSAG